MFQPREREREKHDLFCDTHTTIELHSQHKEIVTRSISDGIEENLRGTNYRQHIYDSLLIKD